MTAQDYIKDELEKLKSSIAVNPTDDLVEEITRLTLTKKFRKYSLDPKASEHIKNAINLNVEKNEPIKFTVPFGGYKLWRLNETPEADWAELFAMMYYMKWIKPICEIYKPGVWFDFFSDDAAVKRMNNIPEQDTLAYRESFASLLGFIKPYQLENLNMTYNRTGDQYSSQAEFDKEFDQRIAEMQAGLNGDFPTFDKTQKASIELNVKLTPEQEKDPLWREKVFLIHEAYGNMSKRRPYYRTPEKIMVVATPLKGELCVGTTKDSIAKFWCGAGALKPDGESYRQLVLSPNQLEEAEFNEEQTDIEGLEGKNFTRIRFMKP